MHMSVYICIFYTCVCVCVFIVIGSVSDYLKIRKTWTTLRFYQDFSLLFCRTSDVVFQYSDPSWIKFSGVEHSTSVILHLYKSYRRSELKKGKN